MTIFNAIMTSLAVFLNLCTFIVVVELHFDKRKGSTLTPQSYRRNTNRMFALAGVVAVGLLILLLSQP